jgi:uncharacterized membrane protein
MNDLKRSPDLLITGALALITLVVAAIGFTSSLQTNSLPVWLAPLGIAMALVLPGYALMAALLPPLDRPTILLLSLGLSLSVDIVGALVLNMTPWGLGPATWAAWLGGITLTGVLVALRRRRVQPTARLEISQLLRLFQPRDVVLFGLAALLLVGSILMIKSNVQNTNVPFTQFWAMAVPSSESNTIQIGVRNQEKKGETYSISIESEGKLIREWQNVTLSPDEVWTQQIALLDRPENPVRVLLYRSAAPEQIYRAVTVDPAGFGRSHSITADTP